MDLYPWQKHMLAGMAKGELKIMAMGRQSGKSTIVKDWAKTLRGFAEGFRLELTEGTVFGQTYYCVEPQGWIWKDFEWKDMVAWCEETMERQPDTITPNLRWYVNGGQFWFRNQKDRDWFIIRWNS